MRKKVQIDLLHCHWEQPLIIYSQLIFPHSAVGFLIQMINCVWGGEMGPVMASVQCGIDTESKLWEVDDEDDDQEDFQKFEEKGK